MNCREQLIQALDFAGRTGSFRRRNIIENAENVCIYGLGRYFEEAFFRHNMRERFKVTILSDRNRQRLEEVAADERYAGLKCVSPEDIPESAAVIVMLGDPSSALEELKTRRSKETYVNLIPVTSLIVESNIGGICEKSWFIEQKPDILKAFDMLHDEESRRVYVHILCERIAPQYTPYTYEEIYTLPEYFRKDLFFLKTDEAFVDCGAYTGDTIESFVEVTGGQFERADAFELDAENFQAMQKRVSQMEKNVSSKIRLWAGGVAERDGLIEYGRGATAADGYSIYNSKETTTAKVFSIDSALGTEKVTMIKMDIEGAELSALKGAAEIIRTQKPKLAICVYHRLEDMWQIPLYLKSLVPEYKISMRQHVNYEPVDTVCYAYL